MVDEKAKSRLSKQLRRLFYGGLAIGVFFLVVDGWAIYRSTELSQRTQCLMNLRAIGAAMGRYNGLLQPKDALDTLVAAGELKVNQIYCPEGDRYIIAQLPTSGPADTDPRRLVAYEPTSNHRSVVNALFADGHAESIRADAFQLPK